MSQEFDSDVLDLVKQSGFYPDEYVSDFEKSKIDRHANKVFEFVNRYKEISDKEYEHALKVWDRYEITTKKYYFYLYLNYSLKTTMLCVSIILSVPAFKFLGCNAGNSKM